MSGTPSSENAIPPSTSREVDGDVDMLISDAAVALLVSPTRPFKKDDKVSPLSPSFSLVPPCSRESCD